MKIPAKYRGALYGIAFFSLVAVGILGAIAPEQVNAATEAATKVVATLATLLALFNVTPDE